MKWYPVKGYEGCYEVSEDGTQVRSVPRKRTFGNSTRTLPSRIMRLNGEGKYVLRTLENGPRLVAPSRIVPVKPDDAGK